MIGELSECITTRVNMKRFFFGLLLFISVYVTFRIHSLSLPERSKGNVVKSLSACEPQHPCLYNDTVDLRIIVLTFNRPRSLSKLFDTLNALQLDSHSAALEIWIDRQRETGIVNERTVNVASEFRWRGGPTRVHVHQTHVGIHGQWINTWRPRDDSINELALIVEDDMSISKYAYRWMLAVFRAYGHRMDFAGASLTSYQMPFLSMPYHMRPLAGPKNHTVLMYKCLWWGAFAPQPMHWIFFQVSQSYL